MAARPLTDEQCRAALAAIERHDGNFTAAAGELGLNPKTFRHHVDVAKSRRLSALIMERVLGMRLAENPGTLPAPGAWVTGGLLLWTLAFHLLVAGRPPAVEKPDEAEDEAEDDDDAVDPRISPLVRLRAAVELLRPGVQFEALELREAVDERRAAFPRTISPLVEEIFVELTGAERPWAHQVELLDHLGELWRMQAGPERGGAGGLPWETEAATAPQSGSGTR